jgi:hypothetical protein
LYILISKPPGKKLQLTSAAAAFESGSCISCFDHRSLADDSCS